MDVDLGEGVLDRRADLDVVVTREAGVNAALQAHLDRAALPGLAASADDLFERHQIGAATEVLGELPLREGAEAAAEVADVRVVDVARDNVGNGVAVDLAAKLVGTADDRRPVPAARLQEHRRIPLSGS